LGVIHIKKCNENMKIKKFKKKVRKYFFYSGFYLYSFLGEGEREQGEYNRI